MKIKQPLIDPVFLRDSLYSFYNLEGKRLPKSINFAIARNKIDLILHQQRIEYYASQKNNNELFTALVDLFIVLGNKGFEFKSRMVHCYQNGLKDEQLKLFNRMLSNQLTAEEPLANIKHSIFNLGLEGSLLSENHLLSVVNQDNHETSA